MQNRTRREGRIFADDSTWAGRSLPCAEIPGTGSWSLEVIEEEEEEGREKEEEWISSSSSSSLVVASLVLDVRPTCRSYEGLPWTAFFSSFASRR